MGRWLRVAALVVLVAVPVPAAALRCGDRVVALGDRKVEVLARCGEPVDREERQVETVERVFREGESAALIDESRSISEVETWVYDFGPTRLLHFLRFREGRLAEIATGGYGRSPGGAECPGEVLSRGRRRYEVFARCGEPASRDVRLEERARTVADRRRGEVRERRVTVTVEEWVYNFGPSRLLTVVTIEDGEVVGVETGGYGY